MLAEACMHERHELHVCTECGYSTNKLLGEEAVRFWSLLPFPRTRKPTLISTSHFIAPRTHSSAAKRSAVCVANVRLACNGSFCASALLGSARCRSHLAFESRGSAFFPQLQILLQGWRVVRGYLDSARLRLGPRLLITRHLVDVASQVYKSIPSRVVYLRNDYASSYTHISVCSEAKKWSTMASTPAMGEPIRRIEQDAG